MHWRPTRLLTTVAVIGLCAFAAWRGVDIVRFVAASEGATADQHRVEALRPWVATPGLAVAALEASLATALDPTDLDGARRRGEQIGALLARRPLSSMHWLSLAGTRLVANEGFDKVLAALALSALTGPNEGSIMLQRGAFGLLQWEILPPDFRKRTIVDLAGALTGMTVRDGEIAPAKSILARKSAETRQDIAALLLAEGVSPAELLRLGL